MNNWFLKSFQRFIRILRAECGKLLASSLCVGVMLSHLKIKHLTQAFVIRLT